MDKEANAASRVQNHIAAEVEEEDLGLFSDLYGEPTAEAVLAANATTTRNNPSPSSSALQIWQDKNDFTFEAFLTSYLTELDASGRSSHTLEESWRSQSMSANDVNRLNIPPRSTSSSRDRATAEVVSSASDDEENS